MPERNDDRCFGPLLRRLRGQTSRSALAKAIGVTNPYLADVEGQRRGPLRPDLIERCCEVLRLSHEDAEALRAAAVGDCVRSGALRLVIDDDNAAVAAEIGRVWPRITPEQCRQLRDLLSTWP